VSALHRDAGGIGLDPSRSEVTLPRHVGFDPGAIGKGQAADIVVEELMAAGAEGACVNLGGDLRVEGLAPMGERRWVVAIDHGADVADLHHLHIGLEAGGVATSTTARRVWSDGDRRMHHIIDPTSGRPSAGAETVTALARTAAGAEVAATSSMLAGEDEALAALTELGADGIVRLATGERLVTDNLRHFRLASLAS
jgi:thiamine biosynthesis lipoprotein